VARSYVGEFITSLQMAGLSVTITLLDDELLSLLNAPAKSVRFVE
jgi:dihydroxyacetone kinase